MSSEENQQTHKQPEQASQSVTQPQVQEPSQPAYAGFWIRWAALFVDIWVGILPSSLVAAAVVLPIILISKEPLNQAFNSPPIAALYDGIITLLVWSYFVYMTYKNGATFGKMAMKLKVVSDDGAPLTIQKTILREVVGKLLSSLVLIVNVLMIVFGKKKQALHDHIAGTYVIQTQEPTGAVKLVVIILAILPILGILLMIGAIILLIILAVSQTGSIPQPTELPVFFN